MESGFVRVMWPINVCVRDVSEMECMIDLSLNLYIGDEVYGRCIVWGLHSMGDLQGMHLI